MEDIKKHLNDGMIKELIVDDSNERFFLDLYGDIYYNEIDVKITMVDSRSVQFIGIMKNTYVIGILKDDTIETVDQFTYNEQDDDEAFI